MYVEDKGDDKDMDYPGLEGIFFFLDHSLN